MQNKYRLLIVEDDFINQRVLTCMLQDMGYAFDVANDGLIALKYIKTTNYHLILMDIRMPNLDGIETTRKIRAQNKNMSVPIIALTAHVYDDEIALFNDAGMSDLLAKPVLYEDLQALLNKWLNTNPKHDR